MKWFKAGIRFFPVVLTVCIVMSGASVFAAYPERDITVIVPFKPGGGSDVIVRAMAPYMKKYLPRPVNLLVQNIDSAGGRIGTFQLYDAKPDGYTIGLLEPFTFTLAEVLGETGGRTSAKMTWLPKVSGTPFILAVNPNSGIKTIQDLKGKKVRAATAQATLPTTVVVLKALGAEPQVVMYGGGSECSLATMRGDTDLVVGIAGTVMRQATASNGKLIPLVTLGPERFADAKNVPAIKELGVKVSEDLLHFTDYYYMFAAPPNLPSEISGILTGAIEKTVKDKQFVEALDKAKIDTVYAPASEVRESVSKMPALLDRYKDTIKQVLSK